MARSSVRDPLEKFRFLVDWSSTNGSEATSRSRAGFHDVQMPKRTSSEITYREGNDPDINMKSPGIQTFENIVLSRGLVALGTQEDNEFYQWMSSVHKPIAGHPGIDGSRESDAAAAEYRKDVVITMLDRSGTAVRQWVVYNSWSAGFTPGSDLDAGEDTEKSLEQLTLAFEDFQEVVPGGSTPVDNSTSL